MQAAQPLTPRTLEPFLLNVATVLPVFIWGPPGIGKSALVRRFSERVGLPCVSLLSRFRKSAPRSSDKNLRHIKTLSG